MNELKVWVVDDRPASLIPARDAVKELGSQRRLEIDIRTSTSFAWPPDFDDGRPPWSQDLPDIVILDLLDDEEVLRGDQFYRSLRKAEAGRGKSARAFVIIWTFYLATPAVEKFASEARATDDRLLSLERKDRIDLDTLLRKCIGRMDEENPMLRLTEAAAQVEKNL
jgi:hypothetical protein